MLKLTTISVLPTTSRANWKMQSPVFKRHLNIGPDYADAHNNLGVVLHDQGKLAESIASIKQALRLKPDYPEAYNNIGNIFKDENRLDEAIGSFQQALQLRPDYPEAHNNYEDCPQGTGQT